MSYVHEQSAANNVPFLPVAVMVIGMSVSMGFDDPALREKIQRAGVAVAVLVALSWIGRWLLRAWHLARYQARSERLRAFAAAIPRGEMDGRGTFQGGVASVTGMQDGLKLRLVVRADVPTGIVHELGAWNSLVELDVTTPGRLERGGGGPKSAREGELERTIARLLQVHGQTRVTLHAGMLRAEAPFSEGALELSVLVAVFRALSDVARLVTREEVDAPGIAGRTFAWSTSGGRLRCPYCKDDLDPHRGGSVPCGGCRTLHHADCLAEGGGCTVLGCSGAPTPRQRTTQAHARRDGSGRHAARR